MKNKILIITIVSVIVISIFTIPCFAFSAEEGQEYTFKDDIDASVFGQTGSISLIANFYVKDNDNVCYSFMKMSYRGYYVLTYGNSSSEFDVWNSDSGWVNNIYRTIVFEDSQTDIGAPWSIFFERNEYIEVASFNYYSIIYDIIMTNVYGDISITPDMKLTVSLIATVLSILCILAPILICAAIFVWILKRV